MSVPLRLCLLALLPFVASSCGKKSDPTEAANLFFGSIANGRSGEAYESTSLGFKAQQTEKRFEQANKELGLVNVKSVTSAPPRIEGDTATLEMQVTDREGASSPLTVTLVDERGVWRVFSVRAPRSTETGLAANLFATVGRGSGFTDGVSFPKPSDTEIRQLIETHLLLFDQSVKAGHFDALYDEIASAWQAQVTKARMKRAFQAFIDGKISVAHIQGQQPIFYDPPAISTEGLLTARGYYAGDPNNVVFGMKFTYEAPKWRIFGLDVSLAQALPGPEKKAESK